MADTAALSAAGAGELPRTEYLAVLDAMFAWPTHGLRISCLANPGLTSPDRRAYAMTLMDDIGSDVRALLVTGLSTEERAILFVGPRRELPGRDSEVFCRPKAERSRRLREVVTADLSAIAKHSEKMLGKASPLAVRVREIADSRAGLPAFVPGALLAPVVSMPTHRRRHAPVVHPAHR